MKKLYVLLMAVMLAVAVIAPAGKIEAAGNTVGDYSRVYNASYLRLRTGPGYGYSIIMNMKKGSVVRIIGGPYNSSWYKVQYQGNTGYAYSPYLTWTGLAGRDIARYYRTVIVVSLARQQVELYQSGVPTVVSEATTGQPSLATPVGTYYIMAKLSPYRMVSPWPKGSPYYYEPSWVKYAMRFRSDGYYIHDAPWRPYYGYGTNYGHYDPDGVWRTGSHGCVNLPLWAETQLWNRVGTGTTVRVVSW